MTPFENLISLSPDDLPSSLNDLEEILDELIKFIHSDDFSSLTGSSSVSGWGVDTWEVDKESVEASEEIITLDVYVQYDGDPDPDRPASSSALNGNVSVRIDPDMKVEIDFEGLSLDEY